MKPDLGPLYPIKIVSQNKIFENAIVMIRTEPEQNQNQIFRCYFYYSGVVFLTKDNLCVKCYPLVQDFFKWICKQVRRWDENIQKGFLGDMSVCVQAWRG